MVEPINFTAALRRSWRLLVVLAALFAVIAVLLPVSHPRSTRTTHPLADDLDRRRPTRERDRRLGHGVDRADPLLRQQLRGQAAALSDAKTPGPFLTMVGAMSASPQTTKSGSGSSTAATAPVVKATKNGTGLVQLTTSAATREESAALTNAYAKVLGPH